MKAFTEQEKKAILFLSAFFVVGIIVGKIRNGMFYSYPTSIHQERLEFKSLDQSVYDDNMESASSESISVHLGENTLAQIASLITIKPEEKSK